MGHVQAFQKSQLKQDHAGRKGATHSLLHATAAGHKDLSPTIKPDSGRGPHINTRPQGIAISQSGFRHAVWVQARGLAWKNLTALTLPEIKYFNALRGD
jgi:hypothetical protein